MLFRIPSIWANFVSNLSNFEELTNIVRVNKSMPWAGIAQSV